MAFNSKKFDIEFTEECKEEMIEIYDYISNNLEAIKAAERLFLLLNKFIVSLEKNPDMYMKIGKKDKLKREYHRIVVKNFIVLYTVDYKNKKVFISRMIYGRRNYLN